MSAKYTVVHILVHFKFAFFLSVFVKGEININICQVKDET